MNKQDPNLRLGILFLGGGIGAMVAIDPWFLGIAFVLAGAHRLFLASQKASAASIEDD